MFIVILERNLGFLLLDLSFFCLNLVVLFLDLIAVNKGVLQALAAGTEMEPKLL